MVFYLLINLLMSRHLIMTCLDVVFNLRNDVQLQHVLHRLLCYVHVGKQHRVFGVEVYATHSSVACCPLLHEKAGPSQMPLKLASNTRVYGCAETAADQGAS